MRRPFLLVLYLVSFLVAHTVAHRGRQRDAYLRVCALTEKYFYRVDDEVSAWIDRCRSRAHAWPPNRSNEDWLEDVQGLMDEMDVSHFMVNSPAEDRHMWEGLQVNTGIQSRYVDGHLLVYRVIAGSPATVAGVRPGDEILSLPGVAEVSPEGAARRTGTFHLRRGAGELDVRLAPGPTTESGLATVAPLANGARLLVVPTLRAAFFGARFVRHLGKQLAGANRVVIDLRDNAGGDYVALMRVLALFLPPDTLVGALVQSRPRPGAVVRLLDDTDPDYQLEQLDRFARVELRVPNGYPRFTGPVSVLVTNTTASAAEIVADALQSRPRTRVMGWPTAGKVVLAMWYGLPEMGPYFSMAIPQAMMVNARGEQLEGRGVRPERSLYHDLETSRRGEDSWINEAAR